MGIKDYHKWMRENHPSAFNSEWLDTYDHIYIDLNYSLHHTHFGAKTETEIVGKLIWFLETIISKFYPTKSITIANDGPAPLAKLLLQRERRSSHSNSSSSNLHTSSLIFTPGTDFMNTIQSKLETYLTKIKKIYKINVVYMIGCEGEAELKLKYKLSTNITASPTDTHLIISNDADIIAMFGSLPPPSFPNVFICSNVGNHKSETEIISMGHLMQSHTTTYGKTKNYGLDFTFISTMLGNDYLPKIKCVDLTKLMNSYKNAIISHPDGLIINQNLEINRKVFIKLLNGILSNTKKQYTNFTMNDIETDLYRNYMDGLLWCLDMYNTGHCARYNYMYENDNSPHPFGLIYHINCNPEICVLNTTKYPTVDPNLYAVLVMPKKALTLINSKYHNFANQCDILYEKELCDKCNTYHTQLETLSPETPEYKQLKKDAKAHEHTHSRIIVTQIMDIITAFQEQKIIA